VDGREERSELLLLPTNLRVDDLRRLRRSRRRRVERAEAGDRVVCGEAGLRTGRRPPRGVADDDVLICTRRRLHATRRAGRADVDALERFVVRQVVREPATEAI